MPCAASCGKMCVKMSKCMIHSLCRWFQSVVYALYFADVLWLTGWESGLLRSRSWKKSRYGSRKSSHGGTGKKKNTQNFRTRLHKRIHVPFRQILLHPAWKILALSATKLCSKIHIYFLWRQVLNTDEKSDRISKKRRETGAFVLCILIWQVSADVVYWNSEGIPQTVGGRFQLPWFYNRWEVMYMENFVTWEQLRFFAWLVLTLIQVAIALSNHHNKRK